MWVCDDLEAGYGICFRRGGGKVAGGQDSDGENQHPLNCCLPHLRRLNPLELCARAIAPPTRKVIPTAGPRFWFPSRGPKQRANLLSHVKAWRGVNAI